MILQTSFQYDDLHLRILADAFIQSDLHCIQVTVLLFFFLSGLAFPGNRTHDLGVASAMLYYLSYRKAFLQESYLLSILETVVLLNIVFFIIITCDSFFQESLMNREF